MRFADFAERRAAESAPAVLNPFVDWAAWIERWEPAYLWHSTAIRTAHEVARISRRRCKVTSEERNDDERGRYWVWRVSLV